MRGLRSKKRSLKMFFLKSRMTSTTRGPETYICKISADRVAGVPHSLTHTHKHLSPHNSVPNLGPRSRFYFLQKLERKILDLLTISFCKPPNPLACCCLYGWIFSGLCLPLPVSLLLPSRLSLVRLGLTMGG